MTRIITEEEADKKKEDKAPIDSEAYFAAIKKVCTNLKIQYSSYLDDNSKECTLLVSGKMFKELESMLAGE